ncbi:MAG: nucleotidyl transferase AbiEii/AbiGii toxin family protein [Elusimicrobia bacterium]|nr:nucleotidyl transferase AbiEii/AbiGii toxin family protein [Elusimicrobiota bacterium]
MSAVQRRKKAVLTPLQTELLALLSRLHLSQQLIFTGGTALSAVYLQHRLSEDLYFSSVRELPPHQFWPWQKALQRRRLRLTRQVHGNRRIYLIQPPTTRHPLKVEFVYFPFEPIERPTHWKGLQVESLLDIAVNKVHAVSERLESKDFVDLFFLFQALPHLKWLSLLKWVRLKYGVHIEPLALAERLLCVHSLQTFPRLLVPLTRKRLHRFFISAAQQLTAATSWLR